MRSWGWGLLLLLLGAVIGGAAVDIWLEPWRRGGKR